MKTRVFSVGFIAFFWLFSAACGGTRTGGEDAPDACARECEGRQCGPDGCGGDCGTCGEDRTCSAAGACEPACTPDCAGRACGPDGCGGDCGTCGNDQTCSAEGVCESGCTPDCAGRTCGPDGCGGDCGACGPDTICSAGGACEPACSPDCSGKVCGPDGCGGDCGTCGDGLTCDAAGECVCIPACGGRECGDDGCGGSCGSCPTNHECDTAGACAPLQVSVNCPAGQVCMIYEYSAYQYSCKASPGGGWDCAITGVIATFPNAWSCRNACRGGALKCGDESKPPSDPVVAACFACLDSCKDGAPLQCPAEVEGGCLWDGQLVYDGETVTCDCT